jgi:hypothetical protein
MHERLSLAARSQFDGKPTIPPSKGSLPDS